MQPQTVLADFRTVAIDQLRESRTNPRRSFDPDKLQELAHFVAGNKMRLLFPELFCGGGAGNRVASTVVLVPKGTKRGNQVDDGVRRTLSDWRFYA